MSEVSVKFGAQDENLTSTLNKVQKELKQVETQSVNTNDKFGMSFKSMATAAAGLAIGIGAIKLAFDLASKTVASFGEALDMGGRLADLSQRTGEQAGNLLVLERAFDNAGAGADKVGGFVNKLQKFMAAASVGGKEQAAVMTDLGVTMKDLAGKTPTEQMGLFAKGIDGLASPTDRAAAAISIFGKSGGELLPVLRNFSAELANAQGQLGSMPGIMNNFNGVFDTVSDNLSVIRGKMTEFAAGVLSKVMPALELVTTALANFDAAGFGARLAGAFVGGESAMKGFSAALAAFQMGNFSDMFQIAFSSVVLQVKQTANEIFANLAATFSASAEFLKSVLGPGSAAFIIAKEAFSLLGDHLSISIGNGLKTILETIPGIGSSIAENMAIGMKSMETSIKNSTTRINNLMEDGELVKDLERAGKAFPESFKAAYESTKPLLSVEEDLARVAGLSAKYGDTAAQRAADQVIAARKAAQEARDAELAKIRALEDVAAKKHSELELEISINEAKAAGNEAEVSRLEGIKIYNKTLEDALKNEADIETATRLAVSAQQAHTAAARSSRVELQGVKTVGDLIAAIDAAAPMRTFAQKAKDARVDLRALKNFVNGDFSKMSVPDIAKKLGIATAKKSAKQLLDEIQAKLDEIKKKPVAINIDKKATKEQLEAMTKQVANMKANKEVGLDVGKAISDVQSKIADLGSTPSAINLDGERSISKIRQDLKNGIEIDLKTSAGPANPTLDAIKTAVEVIKYLVEKIEPKLPQHALS